MVMSEGARPIYYRQMSRTIRQAAPDPNDPWRDEGPRGLSHFFGFQFTDPLTGEHVEKIEEIPS